MMTAITYDHLILANLTPTCIVLELIDSSRVIPVGIIEDIIVTLESWEYPLGFFVVQPKSSLGFHPLILGRPWLETIDALISYMSGQMTISKGLFVNKLTLYPPTQPVEDKIPWVEDSYVEDPYSNDEVVKSFLTIVQSMKISEISKKSKKCRVTIIPVRSNFHRKPNWEGFSRNFY